MKQLLTIATFGIWISLLAFTSCKKEEPTPIPTSGSNNSANVAMDIVGTWSEAQHIIDGNSYGVGETISFFSNGTFTSQFTYPWHCQPGANSEDSGTWSYNGTSSTLTLISTKPQSVWNENAQQWTTYDYDTQIMNVTSFSSNEFIVEFGDVNCGQNVQITFHR